MIHCDLRFRFSVSPNTPSGRSGLKTTSCRFYRKIAHRFVDESNGSPSRNRRYFAERHPSQFGNWQRQTSAEGNKLFCGHTLASSSFHGNLPLRFCHEEGADVKRMQVTLDFNLIIRRRSDEEYPVKSTWKLILAPMRRMKQFGAAGEANREAERILVKIYSSRSFSTSATKQTNHITGGAFVCRT